MNTSKTESVKSVDKRKNIREIYLESINQHQGSKKGGKLKSKNISHIKKEEAPTGSSSYLENEYTLVKKILTATKALEKLKTSGVQSDKANPNNSAKSSAAAFKYKTQEEYYAEILELKKLVKHLQNNEVITKAKLEYYDNELARKEQEILNLLDFKKEEGANSVRDTKNDYETINLRIKAYKLEFSLKRKDAELTKLKSDLKTTDMKELKSQNERLRNELSKALMNDQKILEAQEVKGISFKDGKLVYQLEDKPAAATENDPTKAEVKQNIAKRLQKGQVYEASGSSVVKLGDFKNKITLFGSLKDKVELLDERETELLVEISRLDKKSSHSRSSSRDKSPNDLSKINAVKVLQSVMKGHLERSRSLNSYEKEKMNQVRKRSPSRSKSPRIHHSKASLRHYNSPRSEIHDRIDLQEDNYRPSSRVSSTGSILRNSHRSQVNYSQTDSTSSSDEYTSRQQLIENKRVAETKSGLCCSPWRSFV